MDEKIRDHWSNRAEGYSSFVRRSFDAPKERKAWQDLYKEALGDKVSPILDCGCGPGTVSLRMSDMGYQMTAMDFSENMLEKARENAERYGYEIDFHQGDAENNPFGDESFNAVMSQYMLWTVPHPEKVISEWYRILRPGGRLMYVDGDWFNDPLNTTFRRTFSRIAKVFEFPKVTNKAPSGRKSDTSMNSQLWSATAKRPQDDVRMLEEAGFTNIKVNPFINRRVMPGIRYYANGFTNSYFMITADKP